MFSDAFLSCYNVCVFSVIGDEIHSVKYTILYFVFVLFYFFKKKLKKGKHVYVTFNLVLADCSCFWWKFCFWKQIFPCLSSIPAVFLTPKRTLTYVYKTPKQEAVWVVGLLSEELSDWIASPAPPVSGMSMG